MAAEESISEAELSHISFLGTRYTLVERIGEGSFSTVYKAMDLRSRRHVALKIITKTSSPSRILEELSFLRLLGGRNNCMGLQGCVRHEDQVVAILPYFEATDFREFLSSATVADIRKYLYNLLIAINHVHSNNVIHRDIKPSNFLYNKETGRGVLIDFGLAQHDKHQGPKESAKENEKNAQPIIFFNSIVSKSKPPGYYERDSRPHMKAQRAGTRGFRAPEVLFRCQAQSKAIDMWSAGVLFLTLITAQYPFFYSGDDVDAIVEIATMFGHAEMRKAAKFYDRVWKSNIDTIPEERMSFEKIVESLNPWCDIGAEGYDLLYRMLDLCCTSRITAEDALKHSFFDSL
jgi:cell division control protein 7